MKLLLKGGRVIDPASGLDAKRDVLIDKAKISRIAASIDADGAKTIDCKNRAVSQITRPVIMPSVGACLPISMIQSGISRSIPPGRLGRSCSMIGVSFWQKVRSPL